MQEKLIGTNPGRKSEYLQLLDAMQSVEESRRDNPDLGVLKERREWLGKYSGGDDAKIERRLIIDEFVIRLLSRSNLGMQDIHGAIDPSSEVTGGQVMDEVFGMTDEGILIWNPDRSFGLSPRVKEQFK